MSVEGFLAVGLIGAVALLVAAIVGAAVSVVLSVWLRAVWMVAQILGGIAAAAIRRALAPKPPRAAARNRWPAALRRHW